jgi:DNA repair exonuclease SbcCD ATPase subunit
MDMNFDQLFWAYIGFAIAWLLAGLIFWFWIKKRVSSYRSLAESYLYEVNILRDHNETLNISKVEIEKQLLSLETENDLITSSLQKRQLVLLERENEIKMMSSQTEESDSKLDSLRQEVFRKTEQIDVLYRQVQQKSVQVLEIEKELEHQKTHFAQLQQKDGESLNNPILVEKNNQIATLHTELSRLLPIESKVALQNDIIDEMRIERQSFRDKMTENEAIISKLTKECDVCKEELTQIDALLSENSLLRGELKKQSERMN